MSSLRKLVDHPRAPLAVFVVLALAAAVWTTLWVSQDRWFYIDEWMILSDRDASVLNDFIRPHNSHWVAVPVVIYKVLYQLFGLDSYTPYRAVAAGSHVLLIALVRMVMRRSGAGPWLATGFASTLLLFGPGRENVVWPFQITFTLAIALALAQMLLADHDEPNPKRDVGALGCGLLAIMTSGTALPVVAATGLVLILRRGWRQTVLQMVPLGLVYLWWLTSFDDPASRLVPAPGPRALARWIWDSTSAGLTSVGHYAPLSALLVVGLLVGVSLALRDAVLQARPTTRKALQSPIVLPLALVGSALVFMGLTGWTRWTVDGSHSTSRYLYVYGVLLMPAFALAAESLRRHSRPLAVVLVGAVLAAGVANASTFAEDTDLFLVNQRSDMASIVRLPEARLVPSGDHPVRFLAVRVSPTIGFLLSSVDSGRLTPTSHPLSPAEVDKYRALLAFAPIESKQFLYTLSGLEADEDQIPQGCEASAMPGPQALAVGTEVRFTQRTVVHLVDETGARLGSVPFNPETADGVTIRLDGVLAEFETDPAADLFLCAPK